MVSEVDRAEERRFEMSELTEREKQVDAIRRREEAALDFRAAHEDREPRDDQELSPYGPRFCQLLRIDLLDLAQQPL